MYSQVHFCPACNGKLLSQTNRHGQAFWFCEKKPQCKIQLSDDNDKPVLPKEVYRCSCGKGILLQKRGYQVNEDYGILKERNRIFEEKVGSKTGCAAKWYQSTLHLQNGLTQSCYNTPQQSIDLNMIESTPMALHNTLEKSHQRAEMKLGHRPKGCEYCWRIEDQNSETLSDRNRWNSYLGKDVDAEAIRDNSANYMFNPRFIEVSFSNLCNFMCGYCHPKNSSRYYSEIKTHGKYPNVSHGCDIHFLKIYDEDSNPYLEAFWKWWPTLSQNLKTIRLTGGEPLIQKSTVTLIQKLLLDPRPNLDLSINTNLGLPHNLMVQKCELLQELLQSQSVKRLHFYTSVDTWGKQAEYIRHGLNLEILMKNSEFFLTQFPEQDLSYMVTFNIFSLPQFKTLMQYWLDLKKKFNSKTVNRIRIYLNILTEPLLYSYTLLPREIALPFFDEIIEFANANYDPTNNVGFNDLVITDLNKVKNDYLKNLIEDPEQQKKYRKEFLAFFTEHDRRRKTDLFGTFPEYSSFFKTC